MSSAPFTKSLTWLYKGLGINVPDTPSELQIAPVHPTLDMFQGGWGVAEFHQVEKSMIGGASTSTTIVPLAGLTGGSNAQDVTRIITGLSLQNISVAAGITQLIVAKQRAVGTGVISTFLRFANGAPLIATGGDLYDWFNIGGGTPYWIFEPGTFLVLFWAPALPAAQEIRMQCSWIEVPNGFKPV